MAQTATVVYTIPTPGATGFFKQADVEQVFVDTLAALTDTLGPEFNDANPVVLTSITMS